MNLSDEEKDTLMLIQRVKIAEVIAKISHGLGDAAPAYFDRLMNPMLSLLQHTKDATERASVLSSLSELVKACRGRNVYKCLSEMLLAIKLSQRHDEDLEVRQASLRLLHAIVTSYSANVLEELPLGDILHLLKQLSEDKEETICDSAAEIRKLIAEQLESGFLELKDANLIDLGQDCGLMN
ncbi:unnamed protein product [Gongylonema pulchrum]|uniref:RTP1_C1 domain-containing protein n=1 Tax=Gongylonema pulchrum TaxID=637853 RepID=A0A183EKE5_9BILA|nr:unnamed protein product [Gongylonema pulchrum]